jgi:hypothetical protein
METGMGFVVKVGDANKFPKAPDSWPKCGSFLLEKDIPDTNSSKCQKSSFSFVLLCLIARFFY